MKEQQLYKNLAKYYELIYSEKDYKKEAEKIISLINKNKKSKGKELLDVACGTGKHLIYFKKKFNCTGVDINEGMLKIARKRLPEIKFLKGDMKTFKTKKKFDVITCLFSSLGYMKTKQDLKRAINNLSKNLNPGGIIILEPWFDKKHYHPNTSHLSTFEENDIKIVRMSYSKLKGNISTQEMHYLIANKKGIEYHEILRISTHT